MLYRSESVDITLHEDGSIVMSGISFELDELLGKAPDGD